VRASTGQLANYLAGVIAGTIEPTLITADCFTFTLANGTQAFYTNADYPISFYDYYIADVETGVLGLGWLGDMKLAASDTPICIFLANAVRVSGLRFSSKIGVDVDEQDITIAASPPQYFPQSGSAITSGVLNAGELAHMELGEGPYTGPAWGPSADTIDGVPFMTALEQGMFDYATLQRDLAFLPSATPNVVPIGYVTLFYGLIADISEIGRTEAKMKVKSLLVRLNTDFPRNNYGPTCQWKLYGPGCTLTKSFFGKNGTVLSGSTVQVVNWSNSFTAPQPNQGTITFTSGVLNGQSFQVDTSDSGHSYIAGALPSAPKAGDTFTAYPGCDHTSGLDTNGNEISGNVGCASFNNLQHFGGCPRVPPPATSY